MDITLIRSFLEVARTGSFVAASERLFVTQSAVSLRIARLEDTLGKPLFSRSKAGAVLTREGAAFERYALSILKIWEEARTQIALPPGFTRSLTLGAQYSLWPRLGFRWIDLLRAQMPDLHVRAELGMPERLTRFLTDGIMHAALLYSPQMRPGLMARQVLDDELVMVAPWSDGAMPGADNYVLVDWGPEFIQAHALELPQLMEGGLTMSLGAMVAEYMMTRGKAGYLPARFAKRFLDQRRLYLVPDAHRFPYPVWLVWRLDIEPTLQDAAFALLDRVASELVQDQVTVLQQLSDISDEEGASLILGTANGRSGHNTTTD
ncbi:LysR family transcriptional regulator [Arenibacterium sp. CAU 1754]